MFAVIYRFYLLPGSEEAYLALWKTIASYFVTQRGALGSTLHKGEGGLWIAYSRWPSKAVRDASWPQEDDPINEELPQEIKNAIQEMRQCLDSEMTLPEICLDVVDQFPK